MKNKVHHLLLTEALTMLIQDSTIGLRTAPGGKKLASGTISGYKALLNQIFKYQVNANQPVMISYSYNSSNAFYNKQLKYWTSFYDKFRKYLLGPKVGIHDNYFSLLMKTLKLVFKYLRKYHHMPIGNYESVFYSKRLDPAIICLPPEKLAVLINEYNSLPLEKSEFEILHAFLFGCATGLRFSDLSKCEHKHLETSNSKIILHVAVKKTGQLMRIKIPDWAVPLTNKKKKSTKFLFPLPSLNCFNKKLKSIAKKLGWDWPVVKYHARGGQLVFNSNVKFYDIISSHVMRKTAITTLLSMNVPELIVRELSGHKPASKEFFRYVRFTNDLIDTTTDSAWDKLIKRT